jgi:hypothetical protein
MQRLRDHALAEQGSESKTGKEQCSAATAVGISSRNPVPISSPAVEAESPLRMFCRTAISAHRSTMSPIVNPTVQGTGIRPGQR